MHRSRHVRWRALALSALSVAAWVAASGVLLRAGSAPLVAVRAAGAAAARLDDLVAVCAGAGAWLVLTWLAVGVVASSAAAVRGRAGRATWLVATATAPAALRRGVAGLLGVAVIGSGAGLATAAPAGAAMPPVTLTLAAGRLPATWTPDRPALPAPPRAAARGAEVRVQHGDTLWAIAARSLRAGAPDADVARAWPRWHAANRDVIGPDPSLIRPGQILRPPR